MSFFRRRKSILEGIHKVKIMKITEKLHHNGTLYFIITVKRELDGATREFWIDEDNYLIEKIIDSLFEGDEREEFDPKEFIEKDIIINVKKGDNDYFNISDIKPVDDFTYEGNDEEDESECEEEQNLEDELFKEDSYYVEEEDDLDFDLDDFDLDDDDMPSSRIRNRGTR